MKKISSKTPLESIKESGTASATAYGGSPRKTSGPGTSTNVGMCFGIKSYLHEFYEENGTNQATEVDYLIRQRYIDCCFSNNTYDITIKSSSYLIFMGLLHM